jgi:uncharacterized protein (DUF849 family)
VLQGCPNGARRSGVPASPEQIARDAAEMVVAGVAELHIHPKDDDGADSLRPDHVAAVVLAVRQAVPGVPVGVTTGAWAAPHAAERVRLIRSWDRSALPDYASVNWHEDGARDVAAALLELGVGVEAGLFSTSAGPFELQRSGLAAEMYRVLAEVTEVDPGRAPGVAREHLSRVQRLAELTGRPLLLHGEEGGAWPVLQLAAQLPTDQRIGAEDVLVDPAGRAADNAALVRSASVILRAAGRP